MLLRELSQVSPQMAMMQELSLYQPQMMELNTLDHMMELRDRDIMLQELSTVSTLEDIGELMFGFFLGVVESNGGGQIVDCIKDIEDMFKQFDDIYHNFKKGGKDGLLHSTGNIKKIVEDGRDAMKECRGLEQDLKKLEELISIMTDPWKMLWDIPEHVLTHIHQLLEGTRDAIYAYESHSFQTFGEVAGKISCTILLGDKYTRTLAPKTKHNTYHYVPPCKVVIPYHSVKANYYNQYSPDNMKRLSKLPCEVQNKIYSNTYFREVNYSSLQVGFTPGPGGYKIDTKCPQGNCVQIVAMFKDNSGSFSENCGGMGNCLQLIFFPETTEGGIKGSWKNGGTYPTKTVVDRDINYRSKLMLL